MGLVDLRKYAAFAATLYTDSMDITRAQETSDVFDGIAYPDAPIHTGIACRLDPQGYDAAYGGDPAHEPIDTYPVVYCATDTDVQPGDRITIRRQYADGTVYDTFSGVVITTAGRPNRYEEHMEFQVRMLGDA
jgi:hypothetical protein